MYRRLWLLAGAGAAMMVLAVSATATTKIAGSAHTAKLAAAPFAQAWANVPKTPAARKAKDVLVFGGEQDPSGFNGNQATQASYWAVVEGNTPVVRSVYIVDDNGQYSLDLASAVKATKTGLTITIRKDAFWNWGGKKLPVTNKDLVYTWQQITNPNNEPASMAGYDHISGFKLQGTKTVTFTWKDGVPYADYRDLFSPVYPAQAVAGLDWDTLWADCVCGTDGKPVANGPFMLTNWTKGQGVTLKANPFWYGHKQGLKEIDFKVLTDTNSEIQAMRGGEVDAIAPQPQTALATLQNQKGITYNAKPAYIWEHIDIQQGPQGNPLLKQSWMRQALFLGINRLSLIKAIFSSYAPGQKPLNSIEYVIGPAALPHFKKWSFAQEKARKLLAAHCTGGPSKPTRGNTAIWTCDGQKAEFRWFTTVGNQRRSTSALIFQQQLGAIGIKINPEYFPGPAVLFGKLLPSHNYDLAEYAFIATPDPGPGDEIFLTGGGQNYTSFSNAKVDKLIRSAQSELDPKKRTALYEAVDIELANQLPVIPLYSYPAILIYKSEIKGMEHSNNPTNLGPTWNAEYWHW